MTSDTDGTTNDTSISYNPDYNDQNSDMVLIASDGLGFRVHSFIMGLASGMFKAMIHDGTRQNSSQMEPEPIHMSEDNETIKTLLEIVYPNTLFYANSVPSIKSLEDVCRAAEKYEMSSALHTLRFYFKSEIDRFSPLHAFALACRYGWEDEQRIASTATLRLNLYSAESMDQLRSVPPHGILRLMKLHRTRRDALVASLDFKEYAEYSNPLSISWLSVRDTNAFGNAYCRSPSSHSQTPRWELLKSHLSQEMEQTPDGSSIRRQEFWDQSDFHRIWAESCYSCSAGSRSIVNKHNVKAEVIRVLDALPKTI